LACFAEIADEMKFNAVRDTLSAAVGCISILGVGYPIGLGGTLAKKALIREGDSFAKRFFVGLAATILTGGTGFFPYLIATPGLEAKQEVQAAKNAAAENRYPGS